MKGAYVSPTWSMAERLEHHSMPEPNSGCLLWTAGCNHKGYGAFAFEYKMYKAHRVAWALKHGPIPVGMQVCHKCDVRSCVNTDHLFLGTNADNVRDMVRKGRGRNGHKAYGPSPPPSSKERAP